MAEERGRPENAQRRRQGDSQGALDPGDAAAPGVATDSGGDEGGESRGAAERDPGDAVPPGVAPLEPPEPTEEDLRVLEKLRDLPHRDG